MKRGNEKFIFFCVLACVGLISPPLSAQNLKITKVGEWSTPSDLGAGVAMRVSGGIVYYLDEKVGLSILDVSNPAAPVLKGSFLTSRVAAGICVAGLYAYIVDGNYATSAGTLSVIDVSDPSRPILSGSVEIGFLGVSVAVSGNLAYVVYRALDLSTSGIKIYDVSDPAHPTLKGELAIDQAGPAIAVEGTYACLPSGNGVFLDIVSVAEPSAPAIIGTYRGNAHFQISIFALKGKLAFITLGGEIRIVDISDPAVPLDVGQPLMVNNHARPCLDGNRLYCTDSYTGFTVFDVSDPAHPDKMGGWKPEITAILPDFLAAAGSYAYAAHGSRISALNVVEDYWPTLSIERKQLSFFSIPGMATTSAQTSIITNSAYGTVNWTAMADQSWIKVSPASGTGNGSLSVNVDPTGLAEGAYFGWITVSDPNANNSPQRISVCLEVRPVSYAWAPFGSFDTPIDGTTKITGAIPVTGWALDNIEVAKVEIWRDHVAGETPGQWFIGDAVFVEGARPDIETAYPGNPLNYRGGWGYMLLTNCLPGQGNGTYRLYAYATDKEGNRVPLGTKSITCDNANAVKPFGTIDTPAQGGDASGSLYVNFGWVLTPLNKTVPKDGSTILVFVDGVHLGDLTMLPNKYNEYRDDVAKSFPGLNNTDGPVGAFYLDTTKYTNGVHSIYWVATDNEGATDGIGSRYFNIHNAESSALANLGAPFPDLGQAYSYESIINLPLSFEPMIIQRGFHLRADPETINPDNYGTIHIEMRELERIEVGLGKAVKLRGYLVVGNDLRPLPIGSMLNDEKGIFSWMPGPGYLGTYHLAFLRDDGFGITRRIPLRVTIRPKY